MRVWNALSKIGTKDASKRLTYEDRLAHVQLDVARLNQRISDAEHRIGKHAVHMATQAS
jgi:hypothetical protein